MKFVWMVMFLVLSACATKQDVPPPFEVVEKEEVSLLPREGTFPPLKEVLTLGFASEQRQKIAEERAKLYKQKYVADENDERNILEKAVGALTLGVIMGRETKKQYAARKAEEMEAAALLVADADDKRGLIAKGLHKATMGLIAGKETKEEFLERVAKEEEYNKRLDKRGLLLKSVEVVSLGTVTPGKPKVIYAENAVYPGPKLGELYYGQSKIEDAVAKWGEPIKKVTYPSGEKILTFKVEEASYAFLPYFKKPELNVRLTFDSNGVLMEN